MQKTAPQQMFFHRNVRPSIHSRPSLCNLPKAPLVVDPAYVEISNYTFDKISVVKLTLHNEAKMPRKFAIILPKKTSNFSIQCADSEIAGKDSLELFLWFNPQKEKDKIEDEMIIKIEGETTQIHVPIICFPRLTIGKTDSSKVLTSKQNIGFTQKFIRKSSRRRVAKNSITLLSGFTPSSTQLNSNKDNRSNVVIDFEQKFKKVSEYVRQKYVKNEVYRGAKLLSKSGKVMIKQHHLEVMRAQQQRLYNEITSRHSVQCLSEGPISNTFIDCSVTWNLERNIPRITFELAMGKIQEEVRKYVISMRFERIQASLKFFQDYRQRQQKLGRTFKIAQYIDQHSQRVKESHHNYDLELEFDRSSVKPTFLPVQPEFKTFSGSIQVTQRIGFDNWVPMNIALPGSRQIYGEKDVEIPAYYFHHEQLLNDYRSGGPHQMHYRQPNQILSSEMSNLLPIIEQQQYGPQTEDIDEIFRIIENKDYKDYHLREDDQDSIFPEDEALQLGPLRSSTWRTQTYASIDIFGLLKQEP